MNKAAKKAYDEIKDVLSRHMGILEAPDRKVVLDELEADIEGYAGATAEEIERVWEDDAEESLEEEDLDEDD